MSDDKIQSAVTSATTGAAMEGGGGGEETKAMEMGMQFEQMKAAIVKMEDEVARLKEEAKVSEEDRMGKGGVDEGGVVLTGAGVGWGGALFW